jgi:eukaryotic-like serine/threonine-protein kinase
MTLAAGTRLGPYEITSKLGEGGMGIVWKAKDSHLRRDVALKVLPEGFTSDPERLARFEREARLLAQLNHPNIAQIYGFEASGETHALVMELVDGPTLAERLAKGPLPFKESLSIALQIAQALEEAHEKGIVHRDLKPQNIKASPEGKVKVLDFGLAKALDPVSMAGSSPLDLALSPTLTFQSSREGVILGTAAYMSPEQARGAAVDKRTDIWAFGVVLWEMLVGRRLFDGPSVPDVLGAILRQEVDFAALPSGVPPSIRRLLRRCLERDPKNRLHDIADARLVIEDLGRQSADEPADTKSAPTGKRPRAWRALPWALAALAAATAILVAWQPGNRTKNEALAPSVFGVLIPPPQFLARSQSPLLDLSADGRTLLFVAESDRPATIYRRTLDRLAIAAVEGSEGAEHPLLSPDGQWIAYFADGKLRKVPARGGAAVDLAEARAPRGATWLADGSLIFSPLFNTGLWRIAASGGEPKPVTTIDPAKGERSHRWPQALPDGRTLIFTVGLVSSPGEYDTATIEALRIDTGERRTILEGARMARYTSLGYLVFQRQERLLAVRFDASKLERRGEPFVIEEGVGGDSSSGAGYFGLSAGGTLAFVPEASIATERALLLVDREGHETELQVPPAAFNRPRFSPSGDRIAFGIGSAAAADDDVFVYELAARKLRRLTLGRGRGAPLWSPDGRRIAYTLGRSGERGLAVRAADGSGSEARLRGDGLFYADAWLADGRMVVGDYEGSLDIRLLDPASGATTPLAASPKLAEYAASLSPDGRYLAFDSTESGTDEVFVETFPPGGGKWQVSSSGGICPVWSRDGSELYFVSGSTLMVVAVERDAAFRTDTPRPLFSGRFHLCDPPRRHYDVGPDGRFVVVSQKMIATTPRQLVVQEGWSAADPAGKAGAAKR